MWPVHGYYQCPACLRSYRVPWEGPQAAALAGRQTIVANEAPLMRSNHSAAIAAAAAR